MNPFQKTNFHVAIGVCPTNKSCCVFVDSSPPPMVLQPQHDRRYAVCVSFSFSAAKRTVLSIIISNLVSCKITPESFCPPTNPDNRFYAGLPGNRKEDIIKVVRRSIEGMCVELTSNGVGPIYKEVVTPHKVFDKNMLDASPSITLDRDVAFILNESGTAVHTFIE